MRTYPEIEQEINHCIDERGEVADRASPKLADIRAHMKRLRDNIYQILQRIIQRQGGAIQEQVITQTGDRFVIPVKAPQKEAIPGIVHDSSGTGATPVHRTQSHCSIRKQPQTISPSRKERRRSNLKGL